MANRKIHKLVYWRNVAGFKQADMALLLGCSEGAYCLKENGNTELKRTEMISIQDALNKKLQREDKPITLDEIFLP